MRFQDRAVLVTGGGSGIGQQVCYAAAKEGGRVAVGDLDLERAETTAAETTLGRLDVLVNSAGMREIVPVLELSFEEWQRVITVNLTGTFLPSQAFARKLVAQGKPGSIVNLASTLGLMAAPNRAAYTASKHGVVGLTKQMALELGEKGIRVNAVAPGTISTASCPARW